MFQLQQKCVLGPPRSYVEHFQVNLQLCIDFIYWILNKDFNNFEKNEFKSAGSEW